MANHKSALKRARQNEIRRMRNKAVKTNVKTAVKDIRLSIDENAAEAAAQKFDAAKSVISKAAKKGVIHKKTAARKISRLAKRINQLQT